MRTVDLAAQVMLLLKHAPQAQGYIEDSTGARFYISPANPQRHVHPAVSGSSVARKLVLGDL